MESKILSKAGDIAADVLQTVGIEQMLDKVAEFTDIYIRNPNLIKDIHECLVAKYGDYPFYNDFSAFIYANKTIERLIGKVTNINSAELISKKSFVGEMLYEFCTQYDGHSSYEQSHIKEAFELIFDEVFKEVLSLNQHSDAGKLQASERVWFGQMSEELTSNSDMLNKIYAKVNSIDDRLAFVSNIKDDLEHESPKIEKFLKKIDSVGNKEDSVLDSEDTLKKYQELSTEALIALRGENETQIDRVICSIYCHMAICYANLGNEEKAFECLRQIPSVAAQESKLYQFVNAVLIINYDNEEKYMEAEQSLNKALELDPNYYRAYVLSKYLMALKGDTPLEEIMIPLDDYMERIPEGEKSRDLLADYHVYRGFINKEFMEYDLAEKDFLLAKEYGYEESILDYNLALLYYGIATQNFPKDTRLFCVNVDVSRIKKVIELLRKWLIEEKEEKIPLYIKSRIVGIYVSSCTLLGIKHDLTPVEEYLKLQDLEYEVQRMLILGVDGIVDKVSLSILDEEDALYVRISNKLSANQYNDVKKSLLLMSEEERQLMPVTTIYLVLQASLANHDLDTYYDFRKYISELDELGLVECLDAYAGELTGDIENAKLILDKYAISSKDYHILRNIVNFYGRNGYDKECEQLLLRILGLLENSVIYLDDKQEFYEMAVTFLVNHKSNSTRIFVDAIDIENEQMWKLKAHYYDKIKDIPSLYEMLTRMYRTTREFYLGYDEIVCLIKLMEYDCALEKAQELLKTIHENNIKDKVKVIWLISNICLFLGKNEDSFEWAKKAHELTIDIPGDDSHRGYLWCATRVGHVDDALAGVLEYKQQHPVVISEWMKEVKIPKDNTGEEVVQAVKDAVGVSPNEYAKKEENLGIMYRKGILPNATLLKCYKKDISQLFIFAKKNKLRISSGKWTSIEEKKTVIGEHILVDSFTLLILYKYKCLDALKEIKNIHICHATIEFLQERYMSLNYFLVEKILEWIGQAENIIIDYDGYYEESPMESIFSREVLLCCATANRLQIPFLTSEVLLEYFIATDESQTFKGVQIVNIVTLCYKTMESEPDKLSQMLYDLLEECTFINFTSETILEQIKKKEYSISDCDLDRFFICNTSCDMISFANVYIGVIKTLKDQNYKASLDFSQIVLKNTLKIWRKGTYYRSMSQDYDIDSATLKAKAINTYVLYIVEWIQKVYGAVPIELEALLKEVKRECIHYISENVYSEIVGTL